eukprot:TRINITY_DN9199_c0_g5_i1.p1 TRINITY_DN9199_c0_g5~~TRINITY_DN9199_c0_g5_i1.p1  ORF type:complete len:179 (-),score=47.09 TRINITY_DN9199_c0_g5_i1:276-812(-)
MIGDDGYAKLTDFGLSKVMGSVSKTSSFCGTPEYLAPEVLAGAEYTYSVDWWAFGAFLYELVVGLPPFRSENRQTLYTLIREEDPAIPGYLHKDLQDLLLQLLEKDPNKRLRSAEEVKKHPWFKAVDWDKLYWKKVEAPFVPFATSCCDTRNFDSVRVDIDSVEVYRRAGGRGTARRC